MSFGTNSGAAATNTVQQLDPRIYDQWAGVNDFAKNLAAEDDPFYNGPTHAADNSLYTDARSTLQQGQQAGRGATDQAAGVFGSVANDSPYFINAPQTGDVLDVQAERASAGSIPGSNLSAYTNPYQSQVIDASNREIDRSKQMADNQNAYSASQAGAFGGSRHGILDAENERNYAQMKQDNTNGLLQGGFDRATGLATSDLDRAAGVNTFNAGQMNQAFTGNADRDIMARNADANRSLSALQGNQGQEVATSGLNLQGAQGLLGAGQQQQGLYLNQADALSRAGDQMRTSTQAEYDNSMDKWNAQFNEGDRDLSRLLQPFGILPSTGSGSTGSQTSNSRAKQGGI